MATDWIFILGGRRAQRICISNHKRILDVRIERNDSKALRRCGLFSLVMTESIRISCVTGREHIPQRFMSCSSSLCQSSFQRVKQVIKICSLEELQLEVVIQRTYLEKLVASYTRHPDFNHLLQLLPFGLSAEWTRAGTRALEFCNLRLG